MAVRSYSHLDFPPERLLSVKREAVSVCLPARDEAKTIGRILSALIPLKRQGLVDQLVVVDNSTDGTGEIAAELGAEVYDQEELLPELGPVLGKGDAMWRALHVLSGELICFLDADSEEFGAHFACGLIGPLLTDARTSFVKGYYRRPFRVGETTYPEGGGRVTELTARPLLKLFYPELASVRQPLAGEIAARRELLEQLPFVTGYGVDIALLLDAWSEGGLDSLAQVDLDVRQNAHQSLQDLGPMARAVLHAVASRLVREGRLNDPFSNSVMALAGDAGAARHKSGAGDGPEPVERPPAASLRAAA